ncbi:MAG: GAF and ANTAR domain-containing protein [Mycobacteriaceae bacterium]|nr:GAF and ANTAR domain-containing protein [Mycobacteriaceae bacterium]
MSQPDYRRDEPQFLEYDHGGAPPVITESGMHAPLAHLVRQVQTESRPHPEEVLEQFAALAPEYIPGADEAGVLLTSGKRGSRSAAAGDSCPHSIDRITDALLEGPALDCTTTNQTVRVDDLTTETRWPRFAEAVVAQTPVRSMLSFQLYTHLRNWGALSLYSHRVRGFDRGAEKLGLILATHAALTLEAVERGRQFRSALGSRDIIGQAKGILMERYDIGPGAAFSLLTRLSQESAKPVVVIAKELVDSKLKSARH